MTKLTAKTRNAIPTREFAGPDRSYPIQDRSHAANAKARVANKSPALKARVDAAVDRKYPDMGKRDGKHNGPEMGKTQTPGPLPRHMPPEPNHKAEHGDSGMIKALHAHADREHPVK